MLRAVLFDLGETLINFGTVDHLAAFHEGARLVHACLVERGVSVPDFETFHRRQRRAVERAYLWSRISRRDFNALDVMARINRKMALPTEPDVLRELAELFYQPIRERGTPEPGVHELLRWLQHRPVKLGMISNTFVPGVTLDDHLRREGLLDFFPCRVYSCDTRYRKPRPRIFRTALAELDVQPHQAMFVGDTLDIDVKGANRVGMVSVLKAPNARCPTGRVQPDYVITALTELPDLINRHDQRT